MRFLLLETLNHKGVAGSLNIALGCIPRLFSSGDATFDLDPQEIGGEGLSL